MLRAYSPTIILVLAILAACSLRFAGSMQKRTITQDEGISYLAASGHQKAYEDLRSDHKPPFGSWVRASEHKQLLRPDKPFCFRQIGRDLAETDIHPPLYFWLLHVWCVLFGVHTWTGPTLNIVIATITTVLVFTLGRFLLRDSFEAAAVACVWALSPAVIETGFHARQYSLLALCTVGLVWQVVRCAGEEGPARKAGLVALALFTAAGALTHYHFSLMLAGCGLFLVVRLVSRHKKRLVASFLAIGTGLGLFLALHPHFYDSVKRGRAQAQDFEAADIVLRLEKARTCYASFFIDTSYVYKHVAAYLEYLIVGVVILGTAVLVVVFLATHRWRSESNTPTAEPHCAATASASHRKQDRHRVSTRSPALATVLGGNVTGFAMLYFAYWALLTNLGLYLSAVSPRHGMSPRHLAMAWPFFAFLPILGLRLFREGRATLTMVLCASLLVSGSMSVVWAAARWNSMPDPGHFLDHAPVTMIDNSARGILPRIVWHVPDDRLILAANDEYMLANRDLWMSRMQQGGLYINQGGYGNKGFRHYRILRLLSRISQPQPVQGGVFGIGHVFWIEPANAPRRNADR